MGLTFPVIPMKAALGTMPYDDHNWAFEIKWDGFRALVFADRAHVRVQSSSGREVSADYPELGDLASGLNASSAVLDGELVAFDDHGLPRFELVARHDRPVVFQAFDVLQIDGQDTIALPYADRRRLLQQLVEPGPAWSVPSAHRGDGAELVAATAAQGLEGVMAKRLTSVYQPGRRSPDWRKIKHRRRIDVVIGGFTSGEGRRASTFGALLVGRWADRPGGTLVFVGGVGTGFDDDTLDSLRTLLDEVTVADCPFVEPPPAVVRRRATWVQPVIGATVEIAEFTNDGQIRHASFVNLTPRP